MDTIEQAAELHAALDRVAPHPGAIIQTITTAQGWASNQERHSLTFTSRIAPADVTDPEARHLFRQGFGCVEVAIRARWGGCHHDGTPRTSTEIDVRVIDRLSGGMATRTWDTTGAWGAERIAHNDVVKLVQSLLAQAIAP